MSEELREKAPDARMAKLAKETSGMSEIPDDLVTFDEASDITREAWKRLVTTTSLATAKQAPMAVHGDSVDWATALPSESVDIPPRGTHQPEGDGPEAGPSAHIQEPDYIAQVEQKPELHRAWWRERAIDAAAMGCTFSRASYMQDRWRHFAMFEAWKVRPDDQGEPRWQITRVEA